MTEKRGGDDDDRSQISPDQDREEEEEDRVRNQNARPQESTKGNRRKTIAVTVVLLGLLMTAIDTTAVVLALPVMTRDLGSNLLAMVWVIMGYLLVLTIFATQLGRLGDMYGRVRMYNLGFAIFTVGSLLCGLSQTAPEIIGFRVVQGLGGALIFSNSNAIISDEVAQSRGRAYGLVGIGYSIGAIFGILVGGAIVTFLGWQYIFFINVPIGVAATAIIYFALKERMPRIVTRIDVVGMALLGAGLFLFLYGLTVLTGSGLTYSCAWDLLCGLALFAGFVFWERFFPAPMLDLRMLRKRVFFGPILASFFQNLASFAVLFLLIMYLQGVRGLSPLDSSLLLVPSYLLGGVVNPVSGMATDKYGARIIASLGLGFQACGVLIYSTLSLNSALWVVVLGSLINGVGPSFFNPANITYVMANAPPKAYGVASGLLRMFANAGMVSSFALAILIASLSIPRQDAFSIFVGTNQLSQSLASAFVTGMHYALLTSLSLIVVALVLSLLRGKKNENVG